jgi:DNA-binding NarL/FixJ family response regulator
MAKRSVLVAEDDFLILEGSIRPLLEPEFDVVAAVGSGVEAVVAAREHRPDIALLDVSLPGIRGFEVAKKILANQPECKVIFVSSYSDRAYVDAARNMGASGYVIKGRIHTELIRAIRSSEAGEFYPSNS